MQVVTAIDGGQVESTERPTQIVPVSPADPTKVEKALKIFQASFKQPPDDNEVLDATGIGQQQGSNAQAMVNLQDLNQETGLIGDVQIEFVPELGLVIVKGNKRDVQRVLEVIEKIKKQSVETQPRSKSIHSSMWIAPLWQRWLPIFTTKSWLNVKDKSVLPP